MKKVSDIIDMFQNYEIMLVILASIHIYVYSWLPIKYEVAVEILHVVIFYLLTECKGKVGVNFL